MMVKTLTIKEEVYRRLLAFKAPTESFSDLFERLMDGQGSLASLRSLRGSIEFKDAKERASFLEDATSRRGERRS